MVESGCLLSAVVFHHVHSLFWHAYQYSVCVSALCVCVFVGNTRTLLPSSGAPSISVGVKDLTSGIQNVMCGKSSNMERCESAARLQLFVVCALLMESTVY